MIKKILLSRWMALITLTLLVLLRVADYSFIESVRLRYFDTLLTSKQVEQSERIYVVNIDEKTIEQKGQFPFPRREYARIIEDIFAHGAGVVVFNVYMPDRDRFGFDDILVATLKKYPVVLPQMGDTEKSPIEPFRPGMSELGQPATEFTIDYPGIKPNTQKLNNAVQSAGVANVFPEIDGVVRRVPMVISSDGRLYPSIALESIRMAAGDPSFQIKSSEAGIEAVRVPSFRTISTDSVGRIWIDWSRKPREFSVNDLPKDFAGGVVIVGLTAKGLNNPVGTSRGEVYPHYLQAAVLDTVIEGTNISRPAWATFAELAFIVVVTILSLFLLRYTHGYLFAIALAVAAYYTSIQMFHREQYLLDAVFPILAVVLCTAHGYVVKFLHELGQKLQIKKQFGTYLSPDLVAKLQRQPDLLRLGGDEQELSIMFTDVRGFTSISEHYGRDVQGLTKIMNRYMTAMTRKILENNGTLDKYIGDAQMAFWNAPVQNTNHAKDAVKTALEMIGSLDAFNAEITKEGVPPFGMGLGINTGTVVVGNMGSEQRFDYTCLGDAVNLAARLEGQSKNYGVLIVLGPETAKQVAEEYDVFEMDCIAVKGKKEGVRISTLSKQTEAQNVFLYWYYEGEWDSALRVAKQEVKNNKEMSHYYELMIERLEQGKPNNWSGTYVATSK